MLREWKAKEIYCVDWESKINLRIGKGRETDVEGYWKRNAAMVRRQFVLTNNLVNN